MRKKKRNVIEGHADFDLLDLELVFSCPERFSELSFHDGENSFDPISLMIFFLIGRLNDSSLILPGGLFMFSVSDGYQ